LGKVTQHFYILNRFLQARLFEFGDALFVSALSPKDTHSIPAKKKETAKNQISGSFFITIKFR
jgi:hypothetical protein